MKLTLYPSSKYPLTHFIYQQTIPSRSKHKKELIKKVKWSFSLFIIILALICSVFQAHICVINNVQGPLHVNATNYLESQKNLNQYRNWFWRREYVQFSLGESMIQNFQSINHKIFEYSKPISRGLHIATYKKIIGYNIYVRLPTSNSPSYHKRYPFKFHAFDSSTLKCIVRRLTEKENNERTAFYTKLEYIEFIEKLYSKNSTHFNKQVISACGILVGYSYRYQQKRLYRANQIYRLSETDIIFDVASPYLEKSYLLILILTLSVPLMFHGYYVFSLLSLKIRSMLQQNHSLVLPSKLLSSVTEELWLINVDGSVEEQLLQLDRFIQQATHKFENQVVIIKNDYEEFFVVLICVDFNESNASEYEEAPMIICPVSDIMNIDQYRGICYGVDSSWILWPNNFQMFVHSYADWLHVTLNDISSVYRKKYKKSLQARITQEKRSPSYVESISNERSSSGSRTNSLRQRSSNNVSQYSRGRLSRFIIEERVLQRAARERMSLYDLLSYRLSAASPQFIANFRLNQESAAAIFSPQVESEDIECALCMDSVKLGDKYALWPCPGNARHIFHGKCMLESLRRDHRCPLCRHPVETSN